MNFFTVEKLGPHQEKTPEGFLVCYDVPLARTGTQIYGAGEVYGDALPTGVHRDDPIRVDRPESEVFKEEAIASFQGKVVVDEHPEDEDGGRVDVSPDNWRKLAVGHVLNPRRGKGAQKDMMVGDLVVTHGPTIELIRGGKRELSCGYDATYVPTAPNQMEQRNIRGNHVALVRSGRCGPRCAIADHKHESEDIMEKSTLFDKIRAAFRSRDTDAFDAAVRDAEKRQQEPEIHVHAHIGDNGHMGGGPGGKEGEYMHDDGKRRDNHGESHERGAEDPIPGLTSRVDAVERAIHGLSTDVRDALKHIRGRDDDKHRDDDNRKRHHDAIDAMECDDDTKRRLHDAIDAADDDKHHDDDRHHDDDKHHDAPPFGMEAPPGSGDAARKAHDSAFMSQSFEDTLAIAEILAPGIGLPTFDAKARPKRTFDALCDLRRRALDATFAGKLRSVVEPVFDGDSKKLSCEQLRPLFFAAGALVRDHNNRRVVHDSNSGVKPVVNGSIKTLADFNRAKDAFWEKNSPKTSA